ncbi:MAG: hypothetical protein II677_01680 [Muribaculaceae bacterium]|nr:hypothetical protein [Muribaculaceae bacterium]
MKKVAVLMMSLLCAMSVMAVDKSDVAAPVIEPNEMGFITLKDCPVKAPHVSTFVYDNEDGSMRAKVYVARSLVLWYDDLDVSGAERNRTHYLDANFDGYIDILIGSGESRNYSVLMLWDVEKESFKKVDNSMNGLLMLDPQSKTLLLEGSASWCSMFYSRYRFEGTEMKLVDQLVYITEPSEYGTYGVKAAYTITTDEEPGEDGHYRNVQLSTNSKASLPKDWQRIVNAYNQLQFNDE